MMYKGGICSLQRGIEAHAQCRTSLMFILSLDRTCDHMRVDISVIVMIGFSRQSCECASTTLAFPRRGDVGLSRNFYMKPSKVRFEGLCV